MMIGYLGQQPGATKDGLFFLFVVLQQVFYQILISHDAAPSWPLPAGELTEQQGGYTKQVSTVAPIPHGRTHLASPLLGSVASVGQPAPVFKHVSGNAPIVAGGPVKQVTTGRNLAKSSCQNHRIKNL